MELPFALGKAREAVLSTKQPKYENPDGRAVAELEDVERAVELLLVDVGEGAVEAVDAVAEANEVDETEEVWVTDEEPLVDERGELVFAVNEDESELVVAIGKAVFDDADEVVLVDWPPEPELGEAVGEDTDGAEEELAGVKLDVDNVADVERPVVVTELKPVLEDVSEEV